MKNFEIISDHIKASTFILGDDKHIAPSNVDQGYIVRRLIRRAVRYGKELGIEGERWTKNIATIFVSDFFDIYPELKRNENFIYSALDEEERKFTLTIERGLKELEKIISKNTQIDGVKAFDLYQTFGFPLEMTEEEMKKQGVVLTDREKFFEKLKEHQERSRTASSGKFKGGLADHSQETTRLHTAAHLLLAALRQVLGDHVKQKGSNITAERLRFDFSHGQKMAPEEIERVEKIVNENISKKLEVSFSEMPLDKAREIDAMGVFDSKYGENVKVYKIGAGSDQVSLEICGGPHVENTGQLGAFSIIKEETSSSGIRRIKAVLK